MKQKQENKGKVLVTGASSGIGAVYADRFAKQGFDVILVARDTARLLALKAHLQSETKAQVEVMTADLSKGEGIAAVEEILRTDPAITHLINNAASTDSVPFIKAVSESLESAITLNIIAVTRLSLAAAKAFAERKSGTIVNIGSGVITMPDQYNAIYGGSKAYVLNFTRNIAAQLAPLGIKVQVVLPGAVLTEAWQRSGTDISKIPAEAIMSPEDMVDASLKGLELNEVVTIPSLANLGGWEAFEHARVELIPQIFSGAPAPRHRS